MRSGATAPFAIRNHQTIPVGGKCLARDADTNLLEGRWRRLSAMNVRYTPQIERNTSRVRSTSTLSAQAKRVTKSSCRSSSLASSFKCIAKRQIGCEKQPGISSTVRTGRYGKPAATRLLHLCRCLRLSLGTRASLVSISNSGCSRNCSWRPSLCLFQSRKPAASGIGRKARNLKWCSEPFTVNDSKWCAPNLGLGSIFAPRQTGLTLCP